MVMKQVISEKWTEGRPYSYVGCLFSRGEYYLPTIWIMIDYLLNFVTGKNCYNTS